MSIDEIQSSNAQGQRAPDDAQAVDRGLATGSVPTDKVTLVLRRSAEPQQALSQYLRDVDRIATPVDVVGVQPWSQLFTECSSGAEQFPI